MPLLHHQPHLSNTPYLSAWLFFLDYTLRRKNILQEVRNFTTNDTVSYPENLNNIQDPWSIGLLLQFDASDLSL
jgi:hypothetical protein